MEGFIGSNNEKFWSGLQAWLDPGTQITSSVLSLLHLASALLQICCFSGHPTHGGLEQLLT